jgi:glyoxylase-like metal-dependent hydrolase (beta-lactamase superfamily II)
MDRVAERQVMIRKLGAIVAMLLAPALAAAQDFSRVEVVTTRLSETTYMMTGAGGNLGLSIGDDAVFVIDDQYAPLTDRILAAIARLTPKPVRFVVNTHWHGDHTGGNENFGKAGAILVAHDNVRRRLSTEQFNEFMRRTTPPSPRGAWPVVTFPAAITFHLNGDEMRVTHVPRAHTDGDAIVHFLKSDVIHMGDVFWNGLYPFIDTASGGSVDGTIAACDQALALATEATKIIPGHGPLSNRAGLKAYRDMLAAIAARVRALLDAGRTVDEIVAAKVTAEHDEKWGKGFLPPARFAELVARDILKNR